MAIGDALPAAALPKLTVIVLAYNHENTIAAALDSILSQKTAHAYCIWLCEDHSSDETLTICRDYASRYPEQITLIAQATNTGVGHLRAALERVTTPYLAVLDGDDTWCDDEKIQIAIDTLERRREYVTFAHDTWYTDTRAKTRRSLIHDVHKLERTEQHFDLSSAPYLHMSARIHRNVVDFKSVPKDVKIFDIHLFYLYLDRGPLYYEDRLMSVYNITGEGMWSKLADTKRQKHHAFAYFSLNRTLGYKHDAFFTAKISRRALPAIKKLVGIPLGWNAYLFLRFRTVRY